MAGDSDSEFVPRSGCARALVGALALPSFLVSLVFLIAFPTAYLPWPPKTTAEAIALFALCQLLAAGCLFTLLALVWAIAAPRWAAGRLHSGARRLLTITGIFLLNVGVGLVVPAINGRLFFVLGLAVACVILGVRLLVAAQRAVSPVNGEPCPRDGADTRSRA